MRLHAISKLLVLSLFHFVSASCPALKWFISLFVGARLLCVFSQLSFSFAFLFFVPLSFAQEACTQALAAKKDIRCAFAATEVKIQVEPGKESFIAQWEYTNFNEIPMVVQHIDSSCGCLASQMTGYKQVKQGETGKITAEFRPGNHRGVLRKSMHVIFVGYAKPVELVVEASIPSPVELSTQELIWSEEDKAKTQVIEVITGTNQDFDITGLLGVPERLFTIGKETVIEKRHYRLLITPTGVAAAGIQTLQVRTDSRDPRDQFIAVFLRLPSP